MTNQQKPITNEYIHTQTHLSLYVYNTNLCMLTIQISMYTVKIIIIEDIIIG